MSEAEKIRVLHLLQGYGDSIAYVANQYSRSLDPERYRVSVAYLFGHPSASAQSEVVADEVHFLDLPAREWGGLRIRAVRDLLALCRRERVAVAVCHRHKPAYLMSSVSLACPVPHLLYAVHGVRTLSPFARYTRRLYAALLMRNRFRFITVSDAVRADLLASGIASMREPIRTLHNTLDVEATLASQLQRQEARRILGLGEQDFVFGSVGRLSASKGQEQLVRALAQAGEGLAGVRLAIVGSGRKEEDLRRLVQTCGLLDRVVFCGQVPQAARFMRAFDVFVLASVREPFGMVLLEAMAARLPIISSASGGALEVVGDAALLVQPHTPSAFAARMLEAHRMSAEARARLGGRGFQRLMEHFAHSRFGEYLDELTAHP